jgi:hypothetical protein
MLFFLYICSGFLLLVFACIAVGGPVIKWGGLGSHLPVYHRHICMPFPNQGPGIPRMFFVLILLELMTTTV